MRLLDQIKEWREKTNWICCDNRPEYIRIVLADWVKSHEIALVYLQLGNPQQNAYFELYNRTVMYDWLMHHLFESIDEVQRHTTDWLWTYNNERLNVALNDFTPKMKPAVVEPSTFNFSF